MENTNKTDNMPPLLGKLKITGEIVVKTGLAIGGNKSGIDIGAMDNPVIKTPDGVPFIPGSSLKGKLRALLDKVEGSRDETKDPKLANIDTKDNNSKKTDVDLQENIKKRCQHIAAVFGVSADNARQQKGEALLKVRDAYLKPKDNKAPYTEEKMENSINRVTGVANPRPLERVVPGTVFDMSLCLDVYNKKQTKKHLKMLELAFLLLQEDYLGGGGTRGNGQVALENIQLDYLEINENLELLKKPKEKHEFEFSPQIQDHDADGHTEAKAQ